MRKWKDEALSLLPDLLGKETSVERKVKELINRNKKLQDQLERTNLELVFLKGNLSKNLRIEDQKQLVEPNYPQISINSQCELLQVTRRLLNRGYTTLLS